MAKTKTKSYDSADYLDTPEAITSISAPLSKPLMLPSSPERSVPPRAQKA